MSEEGSTDLNAHEDEMLKRDARIAELEKLLNESRINEIKIKHERDGIIELISAICREYFKK